MSKPQFVFIPGAWHTPVAFEDVMKRLESHGYTVHSTQLPSVGSDDNPPMDLSRDIATLQEIVTKVIGDGNDVIVVPHSWSGVVAGSGLVGYGKKQREERGEKGGVVKAAYMCGFIVPEGVSLMDAIQHKIPDWWAPEGDLTFAKDPNAFYNDVPASEHPRLMAQLKSHSFGTKKAKATAASWKEIPTWYLLCEEDNAIVPFAQELMTGGVKEMGGDIQVERLKSSHSPFLSHPEYVVNWLRRAAGETL